MTGKGRHSSDGSGSFYKDLAVMVGGIVVVGALVFLALVWLADNPTESTTSTAPEAAPTTEVPSTTTTQPDDTTTTEPAPTTTVVPVREPSEITVQVLNSVGIPGAAGRFTQMMASAGYQTLQASDYEPVQDPSRVWYREGFSAEANVVQTEFIPSARVEALPDPDIGEGADIIVVLGTGYGG